MAFGIYGKAGELVESLSEVIARGEPMLVLTPQLIEAGMGLIERVEALIGSAEGTLARSDRALDDLAKLAITASALLEVGRANAALESRKLTLEIAKLERELAAPVQGD